MATQAQKDAFKLKWHRARLMERGLSRTAIAKKMEQFRKQGRVPQAPVLSGPRSNSRSAVPRAAVTRAMSNKGNRPRRNYVERVVRGEGRSERVQQLLEQRRRDTSRNNRRENAVAASVTPRPRRRPRPVTNANGVPRNFIERFVRGQVSSRSNRPSGFTVNGRPVSYAAYKNGSRGKSNPRFSQAAVQRRLRAQKKGKKAVA